MINFLKAKAFALVDKIDALAAGYEDFTRPPFPKSTLSLHEKVALFETDLFENMVSDDGRQVYYERPLNGSHAPVGDLAIWQGYAVAYAALKYAVTKNPDDFPKAWLDGLHDLMVPHGDGFRLVRGYYDENPEDLMHRTSGLSDSTPQRIYFDDASNDSATGILVGCYFASRLGPPAVRASAYALLKKLILELVANDYCLIGANGKPTTYGRLADGLKADGLRMSLLLAILAAGPYPILPNYEYLLRKYRALIPYAKMRFWWINSWSDTHRAAVHLAILRKCSGGAVPEALEGLRRLWALERKTGNTWIAYLSAWVLGDLSPHDAHNAKTLLHEFDVDAQKFNDRVDWTESGPWPGYRRIVRNGKWQASQPVPVHLKGSDDFRWSRNPYSLTSGTAPRSSRHGGLGFLLPYWFGRYLNFIDKDE